MTEDLKQMYKTIMGDNFPPTMIISFTDGKKSQMLLYEKVGWTIDEKTRGLRYGENPGQEAALYKLVNGNLVLGEIETIQPGKYLASDIELLQSGKHPGKTNLTDADNALNILRYLHEKPTVAVMKHNNPCGVAQSDSLVNAFCRAYMADRVAAYGGCIALNRTVDKATAEAIAPRYAEVVVAPEFEEGTLDILGQRKDLRIIRIGNISRLQAFANQTFIDFKSLIDGGIIAQTSFTPKLALDPNAWQLAECEYGGQIYKINRQPTERELEDMRFGWLVEAGITSNSVIYVKDGVTIGIGTGEQDRVGVAEIARDKAYKKLKDRLAWTHAGAPYANLSEGRAKDDIDKIVSGLKGELNGSIMVSDAFFPFRDGIDVGLSEGVRAVIQPGGSKKDYESIQACNEVGATMIFTGQRSFKH